MAHPSVSHSAWVHAEAIVEVIALDGNSVVVSAITAWGLPMDTATAIKR